MSLMRTCTLSVRIVAPSRVVSFSDLSAHEQAQCTDLVVSACDTRDCACWTSSALEPDHLVFQGLSQREGQVFDKIKHSLVIDALRAKQVPSQLIAVLVAWWSQREVSVRLHSVSSHRQIRLQRCVPQGALESLFVFVMTSDCALGQMLVGLLTRLLVPC